MTEIEAIKKVNELHSKIIRSPFAKNVTEIEMLAFIKCKKALEKQIPKKLISKHKSVNVEEQLFYGEETFFGDCPHCGALNCSLWNDKNCGHCGQAIDWSDEE